MLDADHPALDLAAASVVLLVDGDDLVLVEGAVVQPTPTVDQTIRLGRLGRGTDGGSRQVVGDGRAAASRARLVGSVGVAALATGLAARGLEATVDHSRQRVQFGRPIGSFQALKHRMADLHVLVEMSRSASWTAARALAADHPDAAELAHVAAAYCTEAAMHVAAETVQLHGGIAITWEHDAHLLLKRAQALTQLFGQPHEHRAAIEL